jgi:hypothetical protein
MRTGTEKRWVLMAFVLIAAAALLLVGNKWGSPANAQMQPHYSGDGSIMVVPIQTSRDSYGLAMVDTESQTLWIYELNNRAPTHDRLRLLAARSWRYDRLLQRYNTAEPKPEQVRMLVENLSGIGKNQNTRKQPETGGLRDIAQPDERK